jgi:heavy metal sensor kinase
LRRVPIRLRLTAAFAAAMAIVLCVAGLLLYQHLESSLDRALESGLRARVVDVSALVNQADQGLTESSAIATRGNGFAQILDTQAKIFDQTPGLPQQPLLTSRQLDQARRSQLLVVRMHVKGESVRLLAEPVQAQGKRLVVVVGTSLETRDDALDTLRTELFVGGPIALLLASLLGYLVAGAALRPVERMRASAGEISASRPSERLPVPESHDEISRLGETLNDMLGRLEAALERERSFVADASHELRTPLAHLRAEVELALEGPPERDRLVQALRAVGAETDRLTQLAADLLLLARLAEGAVPIRRADVEVGDLLESVATRFARRAQEERRSIEVDGSGRAYVDRLRLEQALGNLVENALRHGQGTIRVSARPDNGSLLLEVRDEGRGFSDKFAEHAFERFRRADASRTSTGAGLGLAIVAAVALAHGGSAVIGSSGAVVAVRVPSDRRSENGSA